MTTIPKTNFTPGPWRADKGESDSWNVLYDDVENDLVGPDAWEAAQVHASCAGGETEANAHLIASAPDMYAALLRISHADDTCREHVGASMLAPDTRATLDAALAKARGETP